MVYYKHVYRFMMMIVTRRSPMWIVQQRGWHLAMWFDGETEDRSDVRRLGRSSQSFV